MNIKKEKDFLVINNKFSKIAFSTAENGRNFNRHTQNGLDELERLKNEFNVKKVVFLNQVHSDKVIIYNSILDDSIRETEGDALITELNDIAIGVFTADCVPVILVDEKKHITAAIHSGWKGTYNSITLNTVNKLKKEYKSNPEDIKAYIGPHIRKCCYEVSEELKEKFLKKKNISENSLFDGRNLNMSACITSDLSDAGIKKENINDLKLCTYCSEDIKLHSYRKSNGDYGRQFSFIIMRQV